VALTGLQEGRHVITLRATDLHGQSSTATVTVYVGVVQTQLYLPIVVKPR
jgi:hypothetical protein